MKDEFEKQGTISIKRMILITIDNIIVLDYGGLPDILFRHLTQFDPSPHYETQIFRMKSPYMVKVE